MYSMRHATRTARTSRELLEASGGVIGRRLEIAAEAFCNPMNGDYAELTLMGSEKIEAITASAAAGLNGALSASRTMGRAVAREADAAREAVQARAQASGPMDALEVQGRWAVNAWNRALRTGWALNASLLETQAKALEPIHAAATANARRLKLTA
jgi:hypothetical protein